VAFPTIPTTAASRVLTTNQTDSSATRTFPSLSSLTKNSGDLLIAIIAAAQSDADSGAKLSAWGGSFTEFFDQCGAGVLLGAAYKWSGGSETGTFTVTQAATIAGHASMTLLSIPGAHASTPPEAGTLATGSNTAANPASFNPSGWDAEDTLWIAVAGIMEFATGGSFTGLASAPANYGNYADTGISADVLGGTEGAVAFRQLNAASEDVAGVGLDTSNARNAAVVIAVRPVAAQTFNQTVTASNVTTSASVVKSVGKIATASSVTTAATLARSVGKIASGTVTTSASIAKSVGKTVAASAVTTAAAIVKSVGKRVTSSNVTTSASLVASRAVGQALSATVTTTASVVRSVGKIVSGTATTSASIARQVSFSLSATVTTSASIAKSVGKIISSSVLTSASIATTKLKLLVMSATVTTSATIAKIVSKAVTAGSVLASGSVTKSVGKALTASTVTASATMLAQKAFLRTLQATVTTSATISRSIGKSMSATANVSAAVVKSVGKTLAGAVTTSASMTADKLAGVFPVVLTATVTVTASIARVVGKSLEATTNVSAAIAKSVGLTVSAVASVTASMVADFTGAFQRVFGMFGNRASSDVGSSPSEAPYAVSPQDAVDSSPMEASFDKPNPESEVS